MHSMNTPAADSTPYVPYYPHKENDWKGWIVGLSPKICPQLFRLNGNSILTWKDGING